MKTKNMVRVVDRFEVVMLFAITIATPMLYVHTLPALHIKQDHLSMVDFELHVPKLSTLAEALSMGLKENYAEVSVKVVNCPNLSAPPFHLASNGLSGSTNLVRIGGLLYLVGRPRYERVYDLVDIGRNVVNDTKSFAVYGGGGGSFVVQSQFCEEVYNLKVNENKSVVNECRIGRAFTKPFTSYDMEKVAANETRIAYYGNLFVSEGKPGEVVQVKVKKRIGAEANFVTACRNAVYEAFGWKVVGIGGVFLIKSGLTMHRIANDWNRFFNITAPLISVGTFLTNDLSFNVKLEHFHSFSSGNNGGNYVCDVDPEGIEYEAYFNVAERAVFIDLPNN